MSKKFIGKNTRRVGTREPLKRIFVLCEGQTEQAYFTNFKSRRTNIDVRVAKAKKTDPLSIISEAKRIISEKQLDVKNKIDEVWCVVDIDVAQDNQYVANLMKQAEKNLSNVVISNPCFEVWFLLHFEKLNNSISVKQILRKLKRNVPDYEKGKCIYKYVSDRTQTAIDNGELLEEINKENIKRMRYKDCDPYTEVYKLVKNLLCHMG